MTNKPYQPYKQDNPSYLVVADITSVEGGDPILSALYVDKESELMDYAADGLSNRQRVVRQYTIEQRLEFIKDYPIDLENEAENFKAAIIKIGENGTSELLVPDVDLAINVGTEIYIPKSKISTLSDDIGFTKKIDNDGETKPFSAFVSGSLLKLLAEPNYKSIKTESGFTEFFPKITVWIWSRVLGELINVSPFIQRCDVQSTMNGSTCSIQLPPLVADSTVTENGRDWGIDIKSISGLGDTSFYASSTLFKGGVIENDFYFNRIISPNDLILIQYETLVSEAGTRSEDNVSLSVGLEKIPDRIYDFIGLVDSVSQGYSAQGADITINVQGRDLTKVLIDDGSYFNIEDYTSTLFEKKPENEIINFRIQGKNILMGTQGFRTVKDHIEVVLSLYTVTGYVPDEVFAGYGDRANESLTRPNSSEFEFTSELKKDVALTSIGISREVYGLKLENENLEKVEIEKVFNSILEKYRNETLSINSVLTQQSRQALDGTLFDPDAPLPTDPNDPRSSERIVGGELGVTSAGLSISSVIGYANYVDQQSSAQDIGVPVNGVWKIIDLEIDPSVSNILSFDTSIQEANGSILETLKSIAEEPLFELFTDTYGDRFKIMARRQPFNETLYNELVNITADNAASINIEPSDVLSYDFTMSDDEVFTWYWIIPAGLLGDMVGGRSNGARGIVSPVALKSYVEIWGSRPYEKTTNFQTFVSKKETDSKINVNLRDSIEQLQFMIESNAYLPFARKGSITINGDRRFKKGMAVRFVQTGEIFHIDSVSNSYAKQTSIDRTTTLNVSRGLVEKYMKPVEIDGIENPVSYFNIVNTDYDKSSFVENENQLPTDILENWGVRRDSNGFADVFDFFLKRRQFQA